MYEPGDAAEVVAVLRRSARLGAPQPAVSVMRLLSVGPVVDGVVRVGAGVSSLAGKLPPGWADPLAGATVERAIRQHDLPGLISADYATASGIRTGVGLRGVLVGALVRLSRLREPTVVLMLDVATGIAALKRLRGAAELLDRDMCRTVWPNPGVVLQAHAACAGKWVTRACVLISSESPEVVRREVPEGYVLSARCARSAVSGLVRPVEGCVVVTTRCPWADACRSVLRARCAVSLSGPVGLRMSRGTRDSVQLVFTLPVGAEGDRAALRKALDVVSGSSGSAVGAEAGVDTRRSIGSGRAPAPA